MATRAHVAQLSASTGCPLGGLSRVSAIAKRVLDVAGGAVLLVVFSPLMLVVAVLVRLTTPGPALFRQDRIGLHGRRFCLLKFRTMYTENDDAIHREYVTQMLSGQVVHGSARLYKLEDDPRVTAVGRTIRRLSIDELPQLINVLCGDMSLVGPRPVLPWEADLFSPAYAERFAVKPGITGLWQVSGRSAVSMTDALKLDLQYVRQRTILLDLWILLRTVPVVLQSGRASR